MADYTTEVRGRVGSSAATSSMADATESQLRFDSQGATVISGLHGAYTEQTKRGKVFTIANQAAVVTVVGLTTTYTGLMLSNPVGSATYISVLRVGLAFIVAQPTTGSVFGLEAGYNSSTNVTHTTPVAPLCSLIGSTDLGVGKGDVSATLPTAPVLVYSFGSVLTEAITAGFEQGPAFFDIKGGIVLKPGGYCGIYTTIASGAASMVASIQYEEIPM